MFTFCLLIAGVNCIDICHKGTSTDELTSALHPGSLPNGSFQAGIFTKSPKAIKLSTCILSCCEQDKCDAVFFYHDTKSDTKSERNTCYLIQCNKTYTGSCDPVQKESSSNKTYFVTVRDVVYTGGGKTPSQQAGACNLLGKDSGCGEHEECKLKPTKTSLTTECACIVGYKLDDKLQKCVKEVKRSRICDPKKSECNKNEECFVPGTLLGVCVCNKGYERNSDDVCVSVIPSSNQSTSEQDITTPSTLTKIKSCEYGLRDQCSENEECFIPDGSHRRTGVCVCIEGFEHNDSDDCVNITIGNLDISAVKRNTTSTPSPMPNTTEIIPTTKILPLTVSAGDNKEIQLPVNEVTLSAYVIGKDPKGTKYDYIWSLTSMPEGGEAGTMVGKNTDTLQLSKLIKGLYTFKIHVIGPHQSGEAFVNVTVLAAARKNTPPVAVIKPVNQEVKLPNSAILDGSDSKDDDKIVKYHWEEKSGPLQDHQIQDDTAMLTLKDLAPGVYIFELTVTDSDGVTNSTIANVTVIKETDYPPKANAGSDIIIHLPQNSVILNGNLSTDDKGIKQYEWIKLADDKLAADMTGVRSQFLHLSNLQEGDYTFTLKVTDTTEQTSSADVHVFVKPDVNHPPKAEAGGTTTIYLPLLNGIKLDASNSTDDKGITKYNWKQTDISGNKLDIKDPSAVVTQATGDIKVGKYVFVLTVKDLEETSSVVKKIVNVMEHPNSKPVANAGADQILTLPIDIVKLDGSKSSDDKGIVHYSWTRDPSSLAAGDPINGSDHQAVLQLVNMVSGHYTFKLTIMDVEGLSASDSSSVHIKENPNKEDLIELDIDTDVRQFTEQDKTNLQSQLKLMLPAPPIGDKTNVVINHLKEDAASSVMKVYFHVENVNKDSVEIRNGAETKKILKEKLKSSDNQILGYTVLNIDTIICQNNCSGHGVCDKRTRKCLCDAFWMENFLITLVLHDESNCDWSILYFIIVTFLIVISTAAIFWGFTCWFKNRRCKCRWRTKKRHRYSLLQDTDYKDEIKLLPKGKTQNSSVMISESDFSSEEETLFVNHKKNGFVKKAPNGISKQHLKNKMKA